MRGGAASLAPRAMTQLPSLELGDNDIPPEALSEILNSVRLCAQASGRAEETVRWHGIEVKLVGPICLGDSQVLWQLCSESSCWPGPVSAESLSRLLCTLRSSSLVTPRAAVTRTGPPPTGRP